MPFLLKFIRKIIGFLQRAFQPIPSPFLDAVSKLLLNSIGKREHSSVYAAVLIGDDVHQR
jgi:hypothetical protein